MCLGRRGGRTAAHRRATHGGARAPPSMFPRRVSGRRSKRLRSVDDGGGGGHADGRPGRARRPRTRRARRARVGRRRSDSAGARRQAPRGGSGRAHVPVRVGRRRGGASGARPRGREEPRDHSDARPGPRRADSSLSSAPSPSSSSSSSPSSSPSPSSSSSSLRVSPWTWAFGGIGVLALGVGAYLELSVNADASGLESSCGHSCSHAQVDSLVLKQRVLGPIAFGVGALSLGLAGYTLLAGPVRGGAMAGMGGRF